MSVSQSSAPAQAGAQSVKIARDSVFGAARRDWGPAFAREQEEFVIKVDGESVQ
jgi:hypothetical protein